MADGFVMIFVACASRKEAENISLRLLSERLVACANIIGGIRSRFWWKGKIDSASEALLIMKAPKANFKKVEAAVKRLHSYEVPEIIAMPIIAGSKDYLKWISESVSR